MIKKSEGILKPKSIINKVKMIDKPKAVFKPKVKMIRKSKAIFKMNVKMIKNESNF